MTSRIKAGFETDFTFTTPLEIDRLQAVDFSIILVEGKLKFAGFFRELNEFGYTYGLNSVDRHWVVAIPL